MTNIDQDAKATEAGRNAANRAAEAGSERMEKGAEATRKLADRAADVTHTAAQEAAGVAQHATKKAQETVRSGIEAATRVAERSAEHLNQRNGLSDHRAEEVAQASQRAVRAAAEAARLGADTAQHVTQSGAQMAAKMAEYSLDHFARTFGFAGEDADQLAQRSSRNVEAISSSGTVLAQGFRDLSREWMDLAQSRLEKNLNGFRALMGCRTFQDAIVVQSDLIRDNLELTLSKGHQIAQQSVQVAEQAAQKIKAAASDQASGAGRSA